jgi:hypothetical protein
MGVMVVGKVVVACIYTIQVHASYERLDVDSTGGFLACEYNNVSLPLPFPITQTSDSFTFPPQLTLLYSNVVLSGTLRDDNYT